MDHNILKFIWRHSRLQQIGIVLLTLFAFPLLYLTLELPKWIINKALGDSQSVKSLFGYALEPVAYLVALCVALMILIILSGLLKMMINTYKGIVGERLIRRLRYSLIDRLLRFPLQAYSRISPGEMIATVSSETEPLAGYIAESIALPLFQGGTMITILVFMFVQDWVFGVVSVILIPVQGYVIPKIQKQVNTLKKDRVRRVRKLSERIGETVTGTSEIRLHGTERYTLAEFSRRFGDLFWVRLEIFKKKFYMKFLNNTIGQITPFFYYLFGGYLVIQGSLTIGALVAAISAYKDLTSPWRELLNHYQLHEDSKIKYQQITEIFDVDGLLHNDTRKPIEYPYFLSGDLNAHNLNWDNENGQRLLTDVNINAASGSTIAIVGGSAVQRSKLTHILSGLDFPISGELKFGAEPLNKIPNIIFRTRLANQGSDPHIFDGSIVDNMEYGLNQKEPYIEIEDSLNKDVIEAVASGNCYPLNTDWVDYRIASQDDAIRNREWYTKVIHTINAEGIIYEKSLYEFFDPTERPSLAESIINARERLSQALIEKNAQDLIIRFDPQVYNTNTSVSENILFGIARDDRLAGTNLTQDAYFLQTIEGLGLIDEGINIGWNTAKRLLELQQDLPPGDDLLEHFGFTDPVFVEELTEAVDSYISVKKSKPAYGHVFLSVFMNVIPNSHPFAGLDSRISASLLEARKRFNENMPAHLSDAVIKFEETAYHPRLSVKDNLLFGRVDTRNHDSRNLLNALITDVVEEMNIKTDLMILFGESQVGVAGSKLSVPARHKIALGRALMKRPDILIFNDALSLFEEKERRLIRSRIRELLPKIALIWIDRNIENPLEFDQIYNFTDNGSLIEDGDEIPAILASDDQTLDRQQDADPFSLISHAILFSPLSVSQRRFLAEHSTLVTLQKNVTIYQNGDPSDAVWMVVFGEVRSYREDNQIGIFIDNDIFGSIEILADRDRMLTLKTTKPARLLRVEGTALNSIASGNADVSRKLLRALTQQWGS